jgi:deoxycytidine triphosphate deaminase/guanylate kinase
MSYGGIVLTGTNASGKTTIATRLQQRDPRLVHVPAITTRSRRPDDGLTSFSYLSQAAFDAQVAKGDLLVSTTYGGESYGIRSDEVGRVRDSASIPILTITPDSAERLTRNQLVNKPAHETWMTVFLDAPDPTLDSRLADRQSASPKSQSDVEMQRKDDRRYQDQMLYGVRNDARIRDGVELIYTLWRYGHSGGVIPGRIITLMLKCGMLLEEANLQAVEGSSYDLALGDEYFYGGRIERLTRQRPILLIEPYDYAIVTSREVTLLPRNVCGRFDLAVGLFSAGVILSNGPQVDPGFRGRLFCLLFNTSSSPVLLKRGQHYATIEFHQLLEPTYSYSGSRQSKLSVIDYLPANATTGAINELKKDLEQVRAESRRLQAMLVTTLSLVLAIIALIVSSR